MSGAPFPEAVAQALSDVQLPPTARLMMWTLATRLDLAEFRPVKASSLGHEMRLKENTIGQLLTRLVADGYLDERAGCRPREFRMMWSRRTSAARAA